VTAALAELPTGWEWSKLGELCEPPQYGYTTKAAPGGDVQFLRTTDLGERTIAWETVPFCSENPLDEEKVALADGDIVISRSGSVGVSALIHNPPRAVFASYLIRFRPLLPEMANYLEAFLTSPFYWAQVHEQAVGIGMNNINAKKLAAIAVPVAPPAEQDSLVGIIHDLTQALDAAREELILARRDLRHFEDSLRAAVFNQGWKCVALGELLREKPRNGLSAKTADDGTTRILTLTAVTTGSFVDSNTKVAHVDPAKAADLWLEPGDILIQRSNTPELVGTSSLYSGEKNWAIFPDLLIRLRPAERISPEFLAVALAAPQTRAYFREQARGTSGSMPKINQGIIEGAPIPVPSSEEQTLFVATLDQRLAEAADIRGELDLALRNWGALRHAIYRCAFEGELTTRHKEPPAAEFLKHLRALRAAADTRRISGRAKKNPRSTAGKA
jgi:type I restriction enzyme S subunit